MPEVDEMSIAGVTVAGPEKDTAGAAGPDDGSTWALHTPDESAVTLVAAPPAETVTVAPGVAVPETSG